MEIMARFSHIIPCRILQSILCSLRAEKSIIPTKEGNDWLYYTVQTHPTQTVLAI